MNKCLQNSAAVELSGSELEYNLNRIQFVQG